MDVTLVNVSARLSSDGSRLISSLLKRAGHKVTSVFLARPEPIDYLPGELECLDEIFQRTDLLLVAVYSSYAIRARQITDYVRRKYPGLKVIWGGPHCISVPDLGLRHADGVCFSEGDEAVVDLVNRIEAGQTYTDCPNMAFNFNGSRRVNPVLPPFADLDSLPYADYDLEDHFLLDGGLFPMTKERLRERLAGYPYYIPILYFTTSRGCPHNCAYCNNCRYVAMFGRNSMRFHSVDRVLAELKDTLETLDFVHFIGLGDDDFFMRSSDQIEQFAQRYKSEIGLPFGVAISANTFRKEKLELLLDAGLRAVQIGVQSGSQRILDEVYSRKVQVGKSKKVLQEMGRYQKKHKLDVLVDFIIDNPYETRDDVNDTYRYMLAIPPEMRINLFFLSFFPGTPLYDQALEDGIIEPFNETASRFYTRSNIRYQKNYETFLILLLRHLRRDFREKDHFPEFALRVLGSKTLRNISTVLPKAFYSWLCRMIN